MMQPDIFHPSLLYFDSRDSPDSDNFRADFLDSNLLFSIPYATTMPFDSSKTSELHAIQLDNCSFEVEELNSMWNNEVFRNSEIPEDTSEYVFPPEQSAMDIDCEWSFIQSPDEVYGTSQDLPTEYWETDIQLSISHLVMAFVEAMEKGQTALGEVIMKRINDKLNPFGGLLERVLFYFLESQLVDKQFDYLRQEATKNFNAAFKAFYQICPYGRFAHFSANSAILEAIPSEAEIIQIFDFDIGDGVQWSPIVEAIGPQQRELRLTTVKWDNNHWKLEETKKRLHDHARAFGVKLKVDEIDLNDLSKLKKIKKRGDKREWLCFNCMVSLPHMGRRRSGKDVMVFLRAAEELLNCNNDGNCKGLMTLGDGDAWEKVKNSSNYGSFLNGILVHYQTLLESIECNFPSHFREGRTAMECLFVAPFLSSPVWNKEWLENKDIYDLQLAVANEGMKVSKQRLLEAKELVNEAGSPFGVRIEGEDGHEMVLEWQKTPLVKVSCRKI